MAKTKQEILLAQQAKYNKLYQAICIIPDDIPITQGSVYSFSVDFHTEKMSVKEYHKYTESLVDWELHSYNYLGKDYNNERIHRLSVTHRLQIGDAYEDGYFIEIHFSIHTAAYKKFLDFVSDGKCQVKTEWVIPKNTPYESTTLTCGG